jgi:hypothetical protein
MIRVIADVMDRTKDEKIRYHFKYSLDYKLI